MPALYTILQTAVEVLNREGFPPEAVSASLYLSGELADLLNRWAQQGILATLDQHSRTATYGMLSRLERFREIRYSRQMEAILDAIRRGSFAQEWAPSSPTVIRACKSCAVRSKSRPRTGRNSASCRR